MLVRMWHNRNSHVLLAEMQNDTAILKNNLAISYKVEHILTI